MFDFIETIPRYQRILIVSLFVVIIFTCYYYFLIKPQQKEIMDLTEKLDSLNTQIQSIRAVETQLSTVQNVNEELKKKIQGLSRILPDKADIDNFLREIVAKASEAGLSIFSFIPQAEREPVLEDNTEGKEEAKGGKDEEVPFMELPIKMKVNGSYDQISGFCEKVSKISRIVNINDLKMRLNKNAKGSKNLIEAEYLATTFRSTEPVVVPEEEEEEAAEKEKPASAEELPTYQEGSYKDPFVSLLQSDTEFGEKTKECSGFECLNISDLSLTGIIELKSGYGAMIHGNDGIGYMVVAGDKLFDGKVKSVTKEFAVFTKEVKDIVRDRMFEIERVLYISPE
ncbi:type 4a pilus biogenesis protein PilO [bacterium]|nr:type 4a pilus biogenesis protein PilO [bacterium]